MDELWDLRSEIEKIKDEMPKMVGYCLFCQKEERIAKATLNGDIATIEYPCGNVDTYQIPMQGTD